MQKLLLLVGGILFLFGATQVYQVVTLLPSPTLIQPFSGATIEKMPVTFTWSIVTGASEYAIQVTQNITFSSVIDQSTVTSALYNSPKSFVDGMYYWRVKARKGTSESRWSAARSFVVKNAEQAPTTPPLPVLPTTSSTTLPEQTPATTTQPSSATSSPTATAPVAPVVRPVPTTTPTAQPITSSTTTTAPLTNVKNWVNYYGSGKIIDLAKFAMAVIDVASDGGNYSSADVTILKNSGAKVISYLNIGSCEQFRSYWATCDKYKLKQYEGWPDEYWMNVTDASYRSFIINTVAKNLVAKGINGFYLDNLDIYQESLPNLTTAQIKSGIAQIIVGLRTAYPNLTIIAQNGVYSLTDQVLHYTGTVTNNKPLYTFVNGVSHEEVYTNTSDTAQIVTALKDLKSKGLFIMNLEYPNLADTALIQKIYTDSRANGFVPYVSDVNLNKIYFWSY